MTNNERSKELLIEAVKIAFHSDLLKYRYKKLPQDDNEPLYYTIENDIDKVSNMVYNNDPKYKFFHICVSVGINDHLHCPVHFIICLTQNRTDRSLKITSGDFILSESELQKAEFNNGHLIFDYMSELNTKSLEEKV
jgi:hypothetical protein